MPTIFTDEDVQKYTRWQRFKMYAKIRGAGFALRKKAVAVPELELSAGVTADPAELD